MNTLFGQIFCISNFLGAVLAGLKWAGLVLQSGFNI